LADAARLYQAGALAPAETVCRHLITTPSDRFDSTHLLGVLLLARDSPAEAVVWLDLAAGMRPDNAQVWDNLGLACLAAGRGEQAVAAFETAIRLGGETPDRNVNLGNALLRVDRVDAALARFQAALAQAPTHLPAWFNLGRAWERLGRLDDAEQALHRVLPLAPPDRAALVVNALGRVLSQLGRYAAAIALANDLLDRFPLEHRTRWNRGLARLIQGDLDGGWADYEARWLVPEHTPAPRGHQVLDPDHIGGQRVLVVAEQGMGDCIQFARYAPLLAQLGAEVWLSVPADLVWLCRTLAGVRGVVAFGDPTPPPDLVTAMMSLPLAFRTNLATVPTARGYLAAPAHARARWSGMARTDGPPRIGLAWRGSAASAARSAVPLALLRPLLSIPGVAYHALVRDPTPAERLVLASVPGMRMPIDASHDFADTAAVIETLDLVITIDTAVAHLAGALGRPVWVMLPFDPDWRWLTARADTPWYDSARLFRQVRPGDWPSVVDGVHQAVLAWLTARR